jgi:dGTPase
VSGFLRSRESYEKEELERLAPYAVKSAESLGRVVPEAAHAYRTAFQRDRDRVVHSRAFRRLEYKTQVFVYHEGDHYRTRLTHSLEGAQIARTMARALRLNEDLAEAIVLAHDLGHTPFGHAGERALHRLVKESGGFDHNRQSLRVVDLLEERYPGFRGLNLTQEAREGILKHGAPWEHPVPLPPQTPERSLEAQLADLADEIAYTNHDLDDGLRSGLLTPEMLESCTLWSQMRRLVEPRTAGASERVVHAQIIVALINRTVTEVVEQSAARLDRLGARSVAEIRATATPVIRASEEIAQATRDLKRFLFENLYHHPRVLRMNRKAERILGDLYRIYRDDPRQLPRHVIRRFAEDGEPRVIADYIAGMTDRFALAEHKKLLDPHEPV